MDVYEKLMHCYGQFSGKIGFKPQVALVLGSGLGDYIGDVEVTAVLPYGEIEGFPVSTVSGHAGRFVFGHVKGVPVVVMQGRVHYYEGYPMQDVVLPIRLMRLMGAGTLLLTNAAGGVNTGFSPGDFMLLADHISSFVPSPLIGPNLDKLGTRFPDMSGIYDSKLREKARQVAAKAGIKLQEGVYMQLTGPQFESPTEVRMCRILGADAVGMSTACEAVAANHMGMRVCGISCISNMGCGITGQPLTHQEVSETADRVAPLFRSLVTGVIAAEGDK